MWNAEEAAQIAAMDIMYVSQDEIEQASNILKLIQKGELKPNMKDLLL